jgi:hypothetical protein
MGRPDAENKNPGGEAGVCHWDLRPFSGFFNVVRKPVGSNHHDNNESNAGYSAGQAGDH